MKRKKIVLFQSFVSSGNRMYFSIPLALLGISRILDKENYEIKIITPFSHKNYIYAVLKEAKDAICLGLSTATGPTLRDCLKVAETIKTKYPKLPIVWGGWHPSILPMETMKNMNVDIVIKGQGERTFTELVHALEKGKPLENISGILFKDKNGKIKENQDRPLENLDNFPPIPYHLVDVEKFITPSDFGNRSLYYYSSCGCPHRCSFCVEPSVNKCRWVSLSAEKAVDEIKTLVSMYKLDSIQITDSNFFVSEDRAAKFAEKLIQKKVNIKWGNANGRTRQMSQFNKKTWKLLKQSGLYSILVGAESGDNETLRFMKKDITIQDTIKLIKLCSEYNIKALCTFMVGFPKKNARLECQRIIEKDLMSIYETVNKLIKIQPRSRMMLSLYLPYPSSSLFSQSKKLGIEIPNNLEDWSDYVIRSEKLTEITVKQKWVTKKQAIKILMLSNYIFFFLDSDSYNLVINKTIGLKKIVLSIIFNSVKKIVLLRWKYRYFNFPVDFYLFSFLRDRFTY